MVHFQTPSFSYSAPKLMLDQLFWNFILNYLLVSNYANWGCFGVPPSWQLGHAFGLPLCGDQDIGFLLYPRLNTFHLVSHTGVRAAWKQQWPVQSSLRLSPTQVTTAAPVPKPWQLCQELYREHSRELFFLSCQFFSSVPNSMVMWMLQQEKKQAKNEARLKFPDSWEELPKDE